jgi:hypothetical protein
MKNQRLTCYIFIVFALSACGPKMQETPEVQAKSIAYFAAHPAEVEPELAKCNEIERNEISAMSPSKQQVWLETAQGISCGNVRFAFMQLQQQRYIDSDAKWARPAAKNK